MRTSMCSRIIIQCTVLSTSWRVYRNSSRNTDFNKSRRLFVILPDFQCPYDLRGMSIDEVTHRGNENFHLLPGVFTILTVGRFITYIKPSCYVLSDQAYYIPPLSQDPHLRCLLFRFAVARHGDHSMLVAQFPQVSFESTAANTADGSLYPLSSRWVAISK